MKRILSLLLCISASVLHADWWWDDGFTPPPPYYSDCYNAFCQDTYLSLPFEISVEGGYANFFQWPNFFFLQNTVNGVPFGATAFKEICVEAPYVQAFFNVFLPICLPQSNEPLQIELSGIYFSDSIKKTSHIVAPAASPFGLIAVPQINGAPPIVTSADSLDNELKLSADYFGGEFRLKQRFDVRLVPLSVVTYLSAAYYRLNQRYKVDSSGIDASDVFTSHLKETLNTNMYEIGAGFYTDYFPFHHTCFEIGCSLVAFCANSHLSGSQLFIDTSGVLFPSSVTNSVSTWNAKFKAVTQLFYEKNRWRIGVVGRWEFWSYAPGILNPRIHNTNLSAPTARAHIFSTCANLYTIGGLLAFRF